MGDREPSSDGQVEIEIDALCGQIRAHQLTIDEIRVALEDIFSRHPRHGRSFSEGLRAVARLKGGDILLALLPDLE